MIEKFSHCVFLNVTQALPQEGLSPPSPIVRKVRRQRHVLVWGPWGGTGEITTQAHPEMRSGLLTPF